MPKKILVVDDEELICQFLSKVLRREGYIVTTTLNGEEAIKVVKEEEPDLILLDLEMPGISGLEALRQIRRFNNNVLVIIISGAGNKEMLDEVLKLNVVTHIPKPFDLHKLVIVIREALC